MIRLFVSLIFIVQYLQAHCVPSPSCESILKQQNEQVLKKVDKSFEKTEKKLDKVKKNYDKINNELDSDIKQLQIILKEEILTHTYLKKILFQTERENGIKSTQKGKKIR